MRIDHVHFYVEDANQWKNWFITVMGFSSIATGKNDHTHTEIVGSSNRSNSIIFILSSALLKSSPVAQFLEKHPSGVADVAFRVNNLATIIERVKGYGGIIQQPIQEKKFSQGSLKWSEIISHSGLVHTLVERQGKTPILPASCIKEHCEILPQQRDFIAIDHLVLNVSSGELQITANWYESILGFQKKQAFTIETPQSGLYSQVMVHPMSDVKIPINEPLSNNSQIKEFLDINNGSGIQHIALRTNKIIQVTNQLRSAGLKFLKVPNTYYQNLLNKQLDFHFSTDEWHNIMKQNILLDQETNLRNNNLDIPLLLQIFTEPIFENPTFFFEIIERRKQAKGFGEGNFRALFEAIEREQIKRGSLNIS
ncbi:4-hydroxyphenylpyruvate dioxygenase [Crocosphaera sp. UHCC 0190]|uniref:4-hydroxyphenylpyruvate dioxygenase n=1 Tax=Crocosphaera sp. UHCC 0190 TaxID=3110246 RepID=UPI002B1F3BCF|nr:4-hydroxyphenylpyruvate dioxygenase [Crocosphaera sp. UHCC 0190]MEA5508708.1 4-hydroxyphenylpyruvate dioxygenase [Crocosphaera sp. UHCC 0190]